MTNWVTSLEKCCRLILQVFTNTTGVVPITWFQKHLILMDAGECELPGDLWEITDFARQQLDLQVHTGSSHADL